LDRLTPFASGSAFYDFRVLGEGDGKLNIMLMAAKADTINPYLEAISEKGITVNRLTVSPSAIATFCSHGHPQESTIFANLGTGTYEVGLVLDSVLSSFCAGNIDANDLGSSLDAVIKEIDRCAVNAAKRGGPPRLLLCATEGDLGRQLREQVPTATDLFESANESLNLPQSAGHIPAAAAGSMLESLWPQAKGFNLLQKGRRDKATTPLVFTMVLVVALLALGVLYVVAPLRMEEKRLEEIERRISAIRGEVKKVETLKKEVDALETEAATIDGFKKGRPMTIVILKELTGILPKTAWLTRARITDTTVEIEGYAAAATELLSKLEASPYLKKVEFASPTFRDVRLNSDRFVIKMEIEIPGKEAEGKVKQ
jgi:Tfp pilus assembly protein PilN